MQLIKNKNKHEPASREVIKWLIILLIATSAGYGYYKLQYLPSLVAKEQALNNRISKVSSEIETMFREWTTTTVEEDRVLVWSGKTSAVLFVDYSGPAHDRFGLKYDPRWLVWAKTESGRIFTISYYIDENLHIKRETIPQPATQIELAKVLADKGRFDLIQKLGLPIGKA